MLGPFSQPALKCPRLHHPLGRDSRSTPAPRCQKATPPDRTRKTSVTFLSLERAALIRPFLALIDNHQDGLRMYYKHPFPYRPTESPNHFCPQSGAEPFATHTCADETLIPLFSGPSSPRQDRRIALASPQCFTTTVYDRAPHPNFPVLPTYPEGGPERPVHTVSLTNPCCIPRRIFSPMVASPLIPAGGTDDCVPNASLRELLCPMRMDGARRAMRCSASSS